MLKGKGNEVGVGQITEIRRFRDKGLRLVGPLPADLQNYTSYTAAPMTAGSNAEGAQGVRALSRHSRRQGLVRRCRNRTVTVPRGLPALFCLLALVWTVTVSASPFQRAPSDQQILIQLERDWDEAFHHKDVAFIANVLADEFRVTYSDGSQGDKARELKLAAEFNQQIDSATLDEFTVKVYGDTAIVWFTERLVGPSKGRQLTITLKFMDVFVMRDGRWQCVASQSTKVTEPAG